MAIRRHEVQRNAGTADKGTKTHVPVGD